jgi:hypothetical protein
MFTGLGPFYLKDSSTAQNILASGVFADFAGAGAANVINSVANLSKAFHQGPAGGQSIAAYRALLEALRGESRPLTDHCLQAEIHVFEPFVTPEGGTAWREINTSATHFEGLLLGANRFAPPVPNPLQGVIIQQLSDLASAAVAVDKAELLAEPQNRAAFRAQALATLGPPSDPSTEKAVALQALAPPPPPNRRGLFGWICGRRAQVANKEVTGPTSVTLP